MLFKRFVSKKSKKNKNNKNRSALSRATSNKPAVLMVMAFASFGVFLLSRSNAATASFEAESAEVKNGATVLSDDRAASGGKYVKFATDSAAQVTNFSRFPGDPNPLETGKAYWGAAVGSNDDPKTKYEISAGKSLSVRRTYWDWGKLDKMANTARADIQSNRLPFVSTKTPGWSEMASGKRDAEIDAMLRNLDSVGGPVWLTVHHEPEGGCRDNCKGPKGEDDEAGSAGWLAMQKKIRERMDAVGTENIAFVANLMTWTWDKRSGRNPADWWADNVWDVYTANSYCDDAKGKCDNGGESAVSIDMWKNFEQFAISKNIPYGTGEWGDRGSGPGSGGDILKAWNHGFDKKSDLVVWSYFDSDLNSPTGGWTLQGEALTSFQDILKNDTRVMRVNDLTKPIITNNSNYGIMSAQIAVPSNGTYKLWARLNTPIGANELVSLQLDNDSVVQVGGSSLVPNIWSWVDWKNNNNTDKLVMSLTAGTHDINIVGLSPGVMIDKIMITDESCQPTGTGDNCSLTSPSNTDLNVAIAQPIDGQNVSGKTEVVVSPSDNVQEVSFRVNNKWQATVKSAPFVWQWDTTTLPDGPAALTIRARKIGDPGNKYTEKAANVVINNKIPTPEPVDTIAPTKPEGLSINATPVYAWTVSKITYKLTWKASTDDIGVVGYVIERDGVVMGQTSALSFTDKTNTYTKTPYVYTVSAVDGNNNISKKATITATTTCQFIWCSTTVK